MNVKSMSEMVSVKQIILRSEDGIPPCTNHFQKLSTTWYMSNLQLFLLVTG